MTKSTQIAIRFEDQTIKTLDDLRRAEPDIPTRPEMLRRLVERAGKTAEGKRK